MKAGIPQKRCGPLFPLWPIQKIFFRKIVDLKVLIATQTLIVTEITSIIINNNNCNTNIIVVNTNKMLIV